jgi:hypothetical protein
MSTQLANWRIEPKDKGLILLTSAGWKGKPLYRPKPKHDRSQEDQKPSYDAQKPAQEETEPDVCKICYDREINCVFLYATALIHSCICVCCSLWGKLTLLHLLLLQRVWPFVLVCRYACLVLLLLGLSELAYANTCLPNDTPAECGRQMKDCPICRRPIARVVEIFKS